MGCGCGGGKDDCSCDGPPPVAGRSGDEIVFFLRPTTLCGGPSGATFYSPPIEVADFKRVSTWIGLLATVGGSGDPEYSVGKASDLQYWRVTSPAIIGPITPVTTDQLSRYMRLEIVVPADMTAVLWAKAVGRRR